MTVHISSRFDSGAIEVVSAAQANDIHVRIPQDNAAAFAQWFHFRVQGVAGVPCRIVFDNAGRRHTRADGRTTVRSHRTIA